MQYRPEPLRESDRYRGRRRAPTPPRSRYAAVLTTAFVGAGIVAFGAGAGIKDAKTDALVAETAFSNSSSAHDTAATSPNRSERGLATSITAAPTDCWVLPVKGYRITSPFGTRWGVLHAGVDLGGKPKGTPIYAMRDGVVILAEANGGYGLNVQIDHGGGLVTIYGHGSKILVQKGQVVKAGDPIMLEGDSGHAFGVHLHLEIRVNGIPYDPIAWFKQHGVDFNLESEACFGGNN